MNVSGPGSDFRMTLGLDLGSNSIGWALIDEAQGILFGVGVRVFPEGVGRDNQVGEESKNKVRRDKRGLRRQTARRRRRKAILRDALVVCGLAPEDPEKRCAYDALDPYILRKKALTEKLSPFEIGRVLFHLAQRRGFLSNRKTDNAKAKDKEQKGLLAEINELAALKGDKTLGEFFAESREINPLVPVRGKHTRRDMYLDEFERIWEAQRKHHPELLTDDLKYGRIGAPRKYPCKPEPLVPRKSKNRLREFGIHGLLFFQRALYWPKAVVGRCQLEPKRPRCPRADRRAQRFRLLNDVNNLRILPRRGQPRPLTTQERATVIALLADKKERTFKDLRKKLDLQEGDAFNLEAGGRDKILGMPTDALLEGKNLFGRDWKKKSEEEKNEIVRSLIEDDEETVLENAKQRWGCSDELAGRLVGVDLGSGYLSYSLVAIEKLLPHLERGLPLTSRDDSPFALAQAGYLRSDQRVINAKELLPRVPEEIKNPLVRQALQEVRKLVNAIIRRYGKPAVIHVEMAREVKGNAESRKKIVAKMRDRERRREEAAQAVRELGFKVSREAIERYLLWQEQKEVCIYSGKTISPGHLFGGEVEIDHILPESRSLDNSLMNKVVAFTAENREKGNRTPYEWLAQSRPDKYEAVLQRVELLPVDVRFGKRAKFLQENVELEDFLNRQLTDTAYITRQVLDYVRCLDCDDLVATKGQLTAEIRRLWGLNTILNGEDHKKKNREDHRHHAIDALVIALTNRSRLQSLARARGRKEELPPPFEHFREDVENAVKAINVSHRSRRKVSGPLHEETFYGRTFKPERSTVDRPHAKNWIEEKDKYVSRKFLKDLTLNDVENIRDHRVKELVLERLRRFGIDPESTSKIPETVWIEPLYLVGAANKRASRPNVIKKVRVLKEEKTIRPIRRGETIAYVKPGNTHHICLFDLPGSTPERPKRDMVSVTLLEATQRLKDKKPVVCREHPTIPGAKFLMSLSQGEMVRANIRGTEGLFWFRTSASTQGQIYFVLHTDARKSALAEKFVVNANTLKGVKVAVDMLGQIRNAND